VIYFLAENYECLYRCGHQDLAQYKEKTYCEKILVIQEEQETPMHFHWYKVEDIINRAGGNMVIELYNSTGDEKLADTEVEVSLDGVRKRFSAGSKIVLGPGESITLTKGLYHRFWAEKGRGVLVAGEVSKVNDDKTDNRFLEAEGRFPTIEEDCTPIHLLCSEYPRSSFRYGGKDHADAINEKYAQTRTERRICRRILRALGPVFDGSSNSCG
jgi:D-lyxose ketol-isomerase